MYARDAAARAPVRTFCLSISPRLPGPPVTGLTRSCAHTQVPGYTGFIPKIQNTFSTTFTSATRVAMSCPPTPDLETVHIDFARGRRRLQTSCPLPGTGFMGFVPEADADSRYKQYSQGTSVNLEEYYEDQKRKVDRMRRESPKALTQMKNPIRNSSQIRFGDYYYYSGKHMYDTTNAESYEEAKLHQKQESPASKTLRLKTLDATRASTAMSSDGGSPYRRQEPLLDDYGRAKSPYTRSKFTNIAKTPEPNEDENIAYRYKVAQALVGTARLDRLHIDVSDRVTSKVVSGNKDMFVMFNLFAMTGKTLGHGVIGYQEFQNICQKLGVYMSVREAIALFGRYDAQSEEITGYLSYFQFIKAFFGESDQVVHESATTAQDSDDD